MDVPRPLERRRRRSGHYHAVLGRSLHFEIRLDRSIDSASEISYSQLPRCRKLSSHRRCDRETPFGFFRLRVLWRRNGCERVRGTRSGSDICRYVRPRRCWLGMVFSPDRIRRLCALKKRSPSLTTRAFFCSRGGYGSNYLLEGLSVALASPKILLGFSDITSLQIFLWQKFGWVTFYGPMVAAGLHNGAGAPRRIRSRSLIARAHGNEARLAHRSRWAKR